MTRKLALFSLLLFSACGTARTNMPKSQSYIGGAGDTTGSEGAPAPDGSVSGTSAPPAKGADPVGVPADGSSGGSGQTTQAGLLTAGAWDDNLNFTFFRDYLATRALSNTLSIDREDAILVEVTDKDGKKLPGAEVRLLAGADLKFHATVGGEGRTILFPAWDGAAADAALTVEASFDGHTATHAINALDYMKADKKVTLQIIDATAAPVATLDLAFLVDTTDSMGDELSYLQAEVANIAASVRSAYPNVATRYALVTYKDHGDAYLTRSFDFGTLDDMLAKLNAEYAGGGGDTPEAVDEGLAALTKLSWQGAARVVFWTADAPYHTGVQPNVVASLHKARELSLHLYPIAASGTDDLAEAMMRDAAEVTAGRYLFLTDDSGIGNSHQEPHIPCYYVTRLDQAMQRMLHIELSGQYEEPAASEIIRTGGSMSQTGQCQLQSGTVVTAY